MNNNNNKENIIKLCETLAVIVDKGLMHRFLKDLTTPRELALISKRLMVCTLLAKGNLSHRRISKITGLCATTICRVDRFLRKEEYNGYKEVLNIITQNK